MSGRASTKLKCRVRGTINEAVEDVDRLDCGTGKEPAGNTETLAEVRFLDIIASVETQIREYCSPNGLTLPFEPCKRQMVRQMVR